MAVDLKSLDGWLPMPKIVMEKIKFVKEIHYHTWSDTNPEIRPWSPHLHSHATGNLEHTHKE